MLKRCLRSRLSWLDIFVFLNCKKNKSVLIATVRKSKLRHGGLANCRGQPRFAEHRILYSIRQLPPPGALKEIQMRKDGRNTSFFPQGKDSGCYIPERRQRLRGSPSLHFSSRLFDVAIKWDDNLCNSGLYVLLSLTKGETLDGSGFLQL